MTEKLYYTDSHMKVFEAKVLSCDQDKDGYKIVLDRTAFFPEGGGQYADTGHLGESRITDAHERDGMIYHTADAPLSPGITVEGRIDWEKRFERMQQHTGEHIVSGLVHSRFGYDNVGFHLGESYCTLDFNGPITKEERDEIERQANRAVFENLPVQTVYPSKEELCHMDYRSKIEIEGQVRIVTIPGIDVCACCAPHLERTGEIGLIKIVNMMNYKGGVRLTILCGLRALEDYRKKEESVKAISALLCAKEDEIAEVAAHLKQEQGSLKGRTAALQQEILSYRAREIAIDRDIITVFDRDLSGNGPRELMNLLLDRGAQICAVFAGSDEDGYRYVIGSKVKDVRPVARTINEKCSGRGGGKPEMVQGSVTAKKQEILDALI